MSIFRRLSFSLALLASTAGAALAAPVGQVVKLSGTAEITRGNAKGPLQLGTALEPGDRLKTDNTGRVRLQLIDGSTINLGAASELLIDDVVSQGPGTDRQIELELGNGTLKAEAAPATPKSRFEIRTPLAVTAVRGTQWGILSEPQKSDVIILEGRVGIRRNIVSGESAISLTRNHGVTVTTAGLGPIGRWSPEQIAAFEALIAVPGTEIPFNLGTAPALNLTPIVLPPSPSTYQPGRKTNCPEGQGNNCRKGGRDNSSGGSSGGNDGGHDHDHDSNSNN